MSFDRFDKIKRIIKLRELKKRNSDLRLDFQFLMALNNQTSELASRRYHSTSVNELKMMISLLTFLTIIVIILMFIFI